MIEGGRRLGRDDDKSMRRLFSLQFFYRVVQMDGDCKWGVRMNGVTDRFCV